jgi:hypothetical protein
VGCPAPARVASKNESIKENAQTILQNTMVQLGGLYAVSQACLLSFFVPQKCPGYIGCLDFGDPKTGEGRVPPDCLWSPWFKYTSNQLDGHLCAPKGASRRCGVHLRVRLKRRARAPQRTWTGTTFRR